MALVPYAPSNKRARTGEFVFNNSSSNNMQIVPSYTPNIMKRASRGYYVPNRMMNQTRSSGRRRNKWASINTSTNRVYPRPEVKFRDVAIGTQQAPVAITNNATGVTVLNTLAQGTTSQERVGQQVATKSCYYQAIFNLGTVPAAIGIRHILYWDRQYNSAAAPVASDLLANTNYITSPLNLANRNRFVVLADDRLTLSPNGEMIKVLDGFRNINQLSTYNDASNLPFTGALCVLIVSDEPTGDTAPTMYGTWRTRYMDN